MRPIRQLLAVALLAAVALAGCDRGGAGGEAGGPSSPSAAAATASSAAGAAAAPAKPGPEAAVAAARDFLRGEVGMGELVAGRFEAAGPDRGVVTGSGTAELGPFEGRVSFSRPTADAGWLLFYTQSEADGVGIVEATSVRVRFKG